MHIKGWKMVAEGTVKLEEKKKKISGWLIAWLLTLVMGLGSFFVSIGGTRWIDQSSADIPDIVVSENVDTKLVGMIRTLQPRIDPAIAKQIAISVHKWADEYQLPYSFVLGIINKESSFKPIRVSNKDCFGLMQIRVEFHQDRMKKFGIKGNEVFYIDNNIRLGCDIFREYYEKAGSVTKALDKYSGGADRIKHHYKVLSAFADIEIRPMVKPKKEKVDDVGIEKPRKPGKS